jgi:hypothetical protein
MSGVFPFEPNWREEVELEYGLYTKILTSDDGSEQRAALKAVPDLTLTFTPTALDPVESSAMDAALHSGMGGLWIIPIWPLQTILQTIIPVANIGFPVRTAEKFFTVGGWAVLWKAWNHYELLLVSEVNANSITTSPTTIEFPKMSLLLPALPGYISDDFDNLRDLADTGEGRLVCELLTIETVGVTPV